MTIIAVMGSGPIAKQSSVTHRGQAASAVGYDIQHASLKRDLITSVMLGDAPGLATE